MLISAATDISLSLDPHEISPETQQADEQTDEQTDEQADEQADEQECDSYDQQTGTFSCWKYYWVTSERFCPPGTCG